MSGKRTADKLGIVLLAAGESSRLGQPKQLLQVVGESLVVRAARRALNLNPACVIVVTGSSSSAVGEQLCDLPVQAVFNPDWSSGMGSSIATGVARLPDELEGVLIMLCDQWQVESRDFERLIESWFSDISDIHVSAWTSSKTSIQGPPAIFPRTLFHELKNLKVDEGARALIARYSERVQAVKMENAAADLDVPDDLQQLINANRSFGNK